METRATSEDLAEKIIADEAKLKSLAEKVAEQTKELEEKISELSHLNEAETGFNPTAAELASEFEGIKAEIKALGK